MFVGYNGFMQPVHVDETKPGEHYQCPICCGELYIRGGEKVCRHFAHKKNTCLDSWTYETNDWHKEMQNLFPKECQEVVVKHNGEVHRADVLIGNIVIEIQHSKMSSETFRKRTAFFLEAGYRVAWIIDFTNPFSRGAMKGSIYSKQEYRYEWSNPSKLLKYAPSILDNHKFSVWFWLDKYIPKLENVCYIKKDSMGLYDLSAFHVSKDITFSQLSIIPERLFTTQQITTWNTGVRTNTRFNSNLIVNPTIKRYVGIKGFAKQEYTCPRHRQDDWIRIFGNNGCFYCKACKSVTKYNNNNRDVYEVECNFYNLSHQDAITPSQKKETDGAPIIDKTKAIYPYRQ